MKLMNNAAAAADEPWAASFTQSDISHFAHVSLAKSSHMTKHID